LGLSCLVLAGLVSPAFAVDHYKLPTGTPELQSAGPLAFGPFGLLLIGDNKAGAIVAVQTDDRDGNPAAADYQIGNLAEALASVAGVDPQAIQIQDLAVNPASGRLYIAITAEGKPLIVRSDAAGQFAKLSLENVPFSRGVLPNVPEDKVVGEGRRARNNRMNAITDLAFVDGRVILSGLSNAAAPSNVRALNFPFEKELGTGSSLEIYHAAHGKVEDYAPIRTFVPMMIDGQASLLAGFVCTPLVRFDLSAVGGDEKVKGTTVAELGNRNQPLDMLVYKQDNVDYLLLANSARGVMKISTKAIAENPGLTEPVGGGGTAGQPYETIAAFAGTVQMDKLGEDRVVLMIQPEGQPMSVKTQPLP
jgi:hypothetical protein